MIEFNRNSGLVLVYWGMIETNTITIEEVPKLLNLREIIEGEITIYLNK